MLFSLCVCCLGSMSGPRTRAANILYKLHKVQGMGFSIYIVQTSNCTLYTAQSTQGSLEENPTVYCTQYTRSIQHPLQTVHGILSWVQGFFASPTSSHSGQSPIFNAMYCMQYTKLLGTAQLLSILHCNTATLVYCTATFVFFRNLFFGFFFIIYIFFKYLSTCC